MKNKVLSKTKSLILKIKNPCYSKSTKFVWHNSDNAAMYKKMPLTHLKQMAIQGGIDQGCDIKVLTKYINKANFILEVGAGYGRVLNHIIKSGFKGKLFAVERSPKLYRFLKKQFPQIPIYCKDIQRFKTKRKFDLILLLWAGLCDFSQMEQLPLLKQLVSCLNSGGFLIIDLIPNACKIINAINHDRRNKTAKTPYGENHGYLPDKREIKRYIQKLNLLQTEIIVYTTQTGKKRKLYVLRKD